VVELTAIEEVRNKVAHIKSAIKKAEKAAESKERNRAVKSKLRSQMKKTLQSLTPESIGKAASVIDKAAAKGVIHKNAANRYKSRIGKKANSSQE
jgi:small subunit ribosomal protein S20